jgi:succinate-semialdehyde dehydrogenase/glutarate-semialdehyde dehydrogenase
MNTSFYSINPLDSTIIKEYPIENWSSVLSKLETAEFAFGQWRKESFETRANLFIQAAVILRGNITQYANKITEEMGKPIAQSMGEVEKCAWVCEYYATNAEDFLKEESIQTQFEESYITYQPLGTILQVMPWNFPFWQVFRFAAPTLMAGNVTLLKHAPNVLGCAAFIQDVFEKAGFPKGIFQCLTVDVDTVEKLMKEPSVQGVALTGSLRAGTAVGALAGKYIKNCVLELGGADPFIVLADADLEKAAEVAILSRMHNSGQTCISAKRFIVVKSVAEKFKNLVKERVNKLVVGSPLEGTTNISVMARRDLAETLEAQVQKSIKMGAVAEINGGHEKGTNYFHPILLTHVKKGMPAYDEELFGPVITFFEVVDTAAAVKLANDSVFGLAATVWSQNKVTAKAVALDLEVGAVAINRVMSSDPRIPFGGIKKSGVGRELGREGLMSFVNLKSVIVG